MQNKIFLFFTFLFSTSLAYSQWNNVVSPTTLQLQSISFATSTIGYAGGAEGTYKTIDGGTTWNKIIYSGVDSTWLEGLNIQHLWVVDANTVYIGGWNVWDDAEAIIKTTNGGTSWSKQYVGSSGSRVNSIFFISSIAGIAVGDNGRILRTTDGTSWISIASGTTNHLEAVYFPSANIGYAAGENVILKTTNGGLNWTVTTTTSSITSLFFTNDLTGYAGTLYGKVLKTIDGGITWIEYEAGNKFPLRQIDFVNDSTGYIAASFFGGSGTIYKTTTYGKYWEPQPSSNGNGLCSVFFIDANNGFSVGEAGRIIRTANGGGQTAPVASFTPDHNIFCKDTIITFLNNGPPNYTYKWDVNGSSVGNLYNLTSTFNPSTTYTVSLISSNNFYSDTSKLILTTQPSLNFVLTSSIQNNNFCAGNSTNVLVPASVNGVVYKLRIGTSIIGTSKIGNGSTLTFPTGIVTTSTTFNLLAEKTNACGINSQINTYVVSILPVPDNTLNVKGLDSTICGYGNSSIIQLYLSESGISYQLRKGTTNIGSSVIGNGGTINLPTGPVTDTVTFNILATNQSTGCNSILNKKIKFYFENPKAILTIGSINSVIGEPIDIYNSSLNGISCQWNFGGDASIPNSNSCSNQTITYSTLGVKPISLTITSTSGCISIVNDTLYIYDPSAQPKECWGMASGGDAFDDGKGISIDDSSNIFLAGRYGNNGGVFHSKIGISGKLPGNGMFLAKYNQYGVIKWLIHISGSTGEDVVVAKSGAIYVTGTASPSSVFYSLDGTSIKPPTNIGVAGYLVKYNSHGKLLWVTYFCCTVGANLSVDYNENIFVGGFLNGGTLDCWIAKYDSTGKSLWYKDTGHSGYYTYSANGNHYYTSGIGVDSMGNCYYAAQTGYVSFMVKYNPSGSLQWTKNISNLVRGLAVDNIGNSYLCFQDNNVVISKYDPSGNLEWANSNPTPPTITGLGAGTAVKLDNKGNIYLAGYGSFINLPSTANSFFLARYSNAGVIQWATLESGLLSNNQAFTAWPHALVIDKKQNCFLTGELGTFIGGPSYIIHKDTILRTQSEDVLFVKYTPDGCLNVMTSSISNTSPFCPGDSLNVFYAVNNIVFKPGNTFVSELSDTSGSFLNITYPVASLTTTDSSGIVRGVIPNNIPFGTKYRIRVRSTNPAISGSDNGQNITINSAPNANAGQDVTICQGGNIQLNAVGGNTYFWNPSTGLSNPNISNPIANPIVTTPYIITITDNAYFCSKKDTLVVTVQVCTKVSESVFPTFNISPNPTSGIVFVNSSDRIDELYITDILGQFVCNSVDKSNSRIDISQQEKGIYILHLKINGIFYSKKIVRF